MTTDPVSIFCNQAHENLHLLERHIMHAKLQLKLFNEYRNETTRQNLVETLDIVQELNRWIISNAGSLELIKFESDKHDSQT